MRDRRFEFHLKLGKNKMPKVGIHNVSNDMRPLISNSGVSNHNLSRTGFKPGLLSPCESLIIVF